MARPPKVNKAKIVAAVVEFAEYHNHYHGSVQLPVLNLDNQPTAKPQDTTNAIDRTEQIRVCFLNDLATLMATHPNWSAPTIAAMALDQAHQKVHVYLVKTDTPLKEQQQLNAEYVDFFVELNCSLKGLNANSSIVKTKRAEDRLLHTILQSHRQIAMALIKSINHIITSQKLRLDDLASEYWGIEDSRPKINQNLAGKLIDFEALFKRAVAQEDWVLATQSTFGLLQSPDLRNSLAKTLVDASLAEKLYSDMGSLAGIKTMASGLVQHAILYELTHSYSMHIGLPDGPPTPPVHRSPAPHCPTPASKKSSSSITDGLSFGSSTSQLLIDVGLLIKQFPGNISDFLATEDRGRGPLELRPKEKQQTFHLLEILSRLRYPSPVSEVFWMFGFCTCRTIFQTERLAGIYAVILYGLNDQPKAFEALWNALKNNKLHELFHRFGYGDYQSNIPELQHFFSTSMEHRPTVWRLIQFLRDIDNLNPSNALAEDYGFALCRNHQEVGKLKDIYSKLLGITGPSALHDACVQASILQLVEEKDIGLDIRARQLLKNINGTIPGRGYEGGRQPKRLFK